MSQEVSIPLVNQLGDEDDWLKTDDTRRWYEKIPFTPFHKKLYTVCAAEEDAS